MSDPPRNGVRSDGGFAFACASCGGGAATLAVMLGDVEVDGGPLPGGDPLSWNVGGPAYRLEFVNVNTGQAPPRLVELVTAAETLDSSTLRDIDWELAAFNCRVCEQNYCSTCWHTWVEFDDGFYDCTRSRCPLGHEQKLDD
ncbi:MAG: hypothetical protein LC679_08375 [Intrasporangiaceae bacterium]|nr:hypothetical protein [Intrasporangiaceae bacterium]